MTAATHRPPHTNNGQAPPGLFAGPANLLRAARAACELVKQRWRDVLNQVIALRRDAHDFGEECAFAVGAELDGVNADAEAGMMKTAHAVAAGSDDIPGAAPPVPAAGSEGMVVRAAIEAGYDPGKCPDCGQRTIVSSGMNAVCDNCTWFTNTYQPRPGVAMAAVPSRFPMPASEPANGVDPSDIAYAPTDRTVFARSSLGRKAIDHEAARANGSEDVLRAAVEAEREMEAATPLTPQEVDDCTMTRIGRIDEHQATRPPGADGGDVAAAGVERNAPAAENTESTPGESGAAQGAPAGGVVVPPPARVGTDAGTAGVAALNTRRAKQRRKK